MVKRTRSSLGLPKTQPCQTGNTPPILDPTPTMPILARDMELKLRKEECGKPLFGEVKRSRNMSLKQMRIRS